MIDVVLLVVIGSYAVSGYRQGLAVGGLSLGGFVLGAVLAMLAVPPLADNLEPGLQRSFAVLVAVLIFAWLGQLSGALIGGRLRDSLTVRPAQLVDQLLGGLTGVVAVGLVLWFVGDALRGSSSFTISQAVGSSRVVNGIQEVMPAGVRSVAEGLRGAVADSPFPRVFAGVTPEPLVSVASPDPDAVSDATLRRVSNSVIKITGQAQACDRGQEGSGAVVAPGRVVTNAHVVAGMTEPFVQVRGQGRRYASRVVLFDPKRDLAVLAVPDLDATQMRLGSTLDALDDAVIAGFPKNGPFKAVPARVRQVLPARGEDIYGRPGVERQVYSLFATVEPGNSGGPVIGPDGSLVGVVFAKSLQDPDTGYALTMSEALPVIEAGVRAGDQVSTGRCASS